MTIPSAQQTRIINQFEVEKEKMEIRKKNKLPIKKSNDENDYMSFDTYDDFMKNVFDKRQSSKKIVANSLYGQCGAKTSSFYDKDIAASTTAVGRKLLLYGKRIVEECYGDIVVETKNHGKVKSNAEYVYGDSVTGDTPLLLRNKNTKQIEFKQINDLQNDKWMCYDGFKAGESNRKEKQQKYVDNYEI
jgi:DNA polymerase elongation subunit (family B)